MADCTNPDCPYRAEVVQLRGLVLDWQREAGRAAAAGAKIQAELDALLGGTMATVVSCGKRTQVNLATATPGVFLHCPHCGAKTQAQPHTKPETVQEAAHRGFHGTQSPPPPPGPIKEEP